MQYYLNELFLDVDIVRLVVSKRPVKAVIMLYYNLPLIGWITRTMICSPQFQCMLTGLVGNLCAHLLRIRNSQEVLRAAANKGRK